MTVAKVRQLDKTDDWSRNQSELYAQMIDKIQVGIVLIDPENKIITNVNKTAAEMIGAQKKQIIGKICHKYICPSEKGKCPITDLGQKVDNSEKILLTANGESVPVLKTVTIVTLAGKEYILDSFIDITKRKRIEKALQESKARLSSILNNSSMVIFLKDLAGKYLLINRRYEDLFHISSDIILGKTDFDIFPEEAAKTFQAQDRRALEEGRPISVEEEVPHDDGIHTYISVKFPLLRTDGEPYAVCGIATDITERKRAEKLLKENEEKFHAISDSVHDAVIMIDNDGKVNFWNKASEKLFGYSSDEAIGKDCHKLIAPEVYQAEYGKGFSKFKNTGTGSTIGQTLRLTALKKDGSEFPVELSVSPLKIKDRWHAVGILRNITSDIQAHEKQAEIITRFTAMINTVPAMMYLKDVENRYIVVNKLFCLNVGKTVDEIIGKTDYDIFPKEEAEKYHMEDKTILEEKKEIINKEEYVKDDQDNTQWLSKTKIPLKDFQDEINGVVGLIQDITEFHRSREQLIQSDKLAAIGTLAAGVAHEINNPIGYINSNLNTMGKYLNKIAKYFDDNKAKSSEKNETIKEILEDFNDAVNESKEGTERVKKIVADLKSFSRVDRVEKEYTDINDGIKSTLNIVWNELKYKCKIEKEFGKLPDLYCIPNQLNQVFMNILLNAGQAITDKSGLIKIRTWNDDNNIYVSIKDNGSGISEKHLKKIFEPFFTTKEVGKGTGLGLSLVFDIIKKHNGMIDVNSEVGVGTEFIIILPLEGVKDA